MSAACSTASTGTGRGVRAGGSRSSLMLPCCHAASAHRAGDAVGGTGGSVWFQCSPGIVKQNKTCPVAGGGSGGTRPGCYSMNKVKAGLAVAADQKRRSWERSCSAGTQPSGCGGWTVGWLAHLILMWSCVNEVKACEYIIHAT